MRPGAGEAAVASVLPVRRYTMRKQSGNEFKALAWTMEEY